MSFFRFLGVVYLLIPTSNHNITGYCNTYGRLYIFWFLHQTTTRRLRYRYRCMLYIFWFLHQTTTPDVISWLTSSCISFDSYIKPQLTRSNHSSSSVVYLLIPTSNHNWVKAKVNWMHVVYLLIPTSNHNTVSYMIISLPLYIFWFLHQTTTGRMVCQ